MVSFFNPQSPCTVLINSPLQPSAPFSDPCVNQHSWWRYGAAAGQATDHAVNSAINVGITAFNIDNLGVKAVVKKTGKSTAKAILEDHTKKLQEKQEERKQGEKKKK